MTDLGGNLDIVASFRSSQNLLLDLYDMPELVTEKVWQAHQVWWCYFKELNQIISRNPAHLGYTAWTPLYSETPYYILQLDFSFMIGHEMFEWFAKPELEATCRKLANPFFHLERPAMLTIWIPSWKPPVERGAMGARRGWAGITEWPEVYRKIR